MGHFVSFSYLGVLLLSDIEKQNMTPPIMQSEAPDHPINRAAPNSYLWGSLHKYYGLVVKGVGQVNSNTTSQHLLNANYDFLLLELVQEVVTPRIRIMLSTFLKVFL